MTTANRTWSEERVAAELRSTVAVLRRIDGRLRMRGPINDELFALLKLPSGGR